jgi:hypothetical protein
MTANDFFLLFVAFGGFLVAPALLLWGIVRLTRGKADATRGPDNRPDVGSPDSSTDSGPAERPDEAPGFSRRVGHQGRCLGAA